MEIISQNYKKGDPFPPKIDPNVMRVYSYQGCPFAERARLVLNAKNIEHEIINVNLLDKPEWVFEKNPVGTLPIIEFGADNKIVTESLIVSEFLDETYSSGRQLRDDDPYQRARNKMFIELVSPHISVFGRALTAKGNLTDVWTGVKESLTKGEAILKKWKTQKFLSGDSAPGLTDYMIWPFIERIPIAIEFLSDTNAEDYIREELPTIHEFRQQMLSDPTVQSVCLDIEVLTNLSKASRQAILNKK